METIINNKLRVGRFTSSEAHRLLKSEASMLEYAEEKRMEIRLGRSLTDEKSARALNWGKLLEKRVFELLSMEYTLCSEVTLQHPEIETWAGSPDALKPFTVCDVKCPVTLKSFCKMVDCFHLGGITAMNEIRKHHSDGEKYYWQLVSNSVLTDSVFAELIVYVPYRSELDEIAMMVANQPGSEISRYYFIANSQPEELPHLIDGGHYKNLNVLNFTVPTKDKEIIRQRMITASCLLK